MPKNSARSRTSFRSRFRSKYKAIILFHLVCFRDMLFYIAVSLLPLSVIWFMMDHITWYVASGYLYSLMVPSVIKLIRRYRRRETGTGTLIQMIKIILLLSTFVMMLMSGPRYVIELNTMTCIFLFLLITCLYYETYVENKAKK